MIPHAENNRTDQNIQTELENFMAETENDEIERQEPAVAEIVGKAIFSHNFKKKQRPFRGDFTISGVRYNHNGLRYSSDGSSEVSV